MDKIIQLIKSVVKQEFQKNYSSGAPKTPPHTHNNIDNLPINAKNIVGLPTPPVTKIIAGNNVTVSPPTGLGSVTINANGSGGSLEVTDTITTVNPTSIITFPSGSVTNSGGGNATITISAGAAGANTTVQYNNFGSLAGDGNFTFYYQVVGFNFYPHLTLGGFDFKGGAGVIFDSLTSSSSYGLRIIGSQAITISPTSYTQLGPASGGGQTNVGINGYVGFPLFGSGVGVIGITDASTTPTTTPSGGGVLYSTGGALHWLGSSGTDTTIAPA